MRERESASLRREVDGENFKMSNDFLSLSFVGEKHLQTFAARKGHLKSPKNNSKLTIKLTINTLALPKSDLLGHCGGQVVCVLDFYYDNPSSNPAEVYHFMVQMNTNKHKRGREWPIKKSDMVGARVQVLLLRK